MGWVSEDTNITVKGGTARIAGRSQTIYRLFLPNRTEEVQLPLVRLCKTLFCQGLLAVFLDIHTLASISKLHVTCSVTKTHHKNPHTHTRTHTRTQNASIELLNKHMTCTTNHLCTHVDVLFP